MEGGSRRVRDLLERVAPIDDSARVLEVGSGAHGLVFHFGTRAVGVDPLAGEYVHLFPAWQRRVPTVVALGAALPFGDRSFDVVLCDNVVDHAERPADIVAEIARVLRPEGLLFFTVNVHHAVYGVASSLYSVGRSAGVPFEVGAFADHTVHLSRKEAVQMLAEQPLEILSQTCDEQAVRAWARQRPVRSPNDLMRRVFFKNARLEVVARRRS